MRRLFKINAGFTSEVSRRRVFLNSGHFCNGAQNQMFRLISTLIKIGIASLATGMVLQRLDLSADEVLVELGITPDTVMGVIERGVAWAIPNIILGSMVILPVWLVVYLFRPPRS